jgi:hypothetical protein
VPLWYRPHKSDILQIPWGSTDLLNRFCVKECVYETKRVDLMRRLGRP